MVSMLLGYTCAHRLGAVVAEIAVAPALTLGETDSKQDPEQGFAHGWVADVTPVEGGTEAGPPRLRVWKGPSTV